ncbi:hypothetical protein XENORESO_006866 [Xenotaenia resolanae]|uniref:Uncharacterized protein n=1 Tax=Xenotaenia resolanae TaxID=208358 RepID=A0ABV0X7A9_9TELE
MALLPQYSASDCPNISASTPHSVSPNSSPSGPALCALLPDPLQPPGMSMGIPSTRSGGGYVRFQAVQSCFAALFSKQVHLEGGLCSCALSHLVWNQAHLEA